MPLLLVVALVILGLFVLALVALVAFSFARTRTLLTPVRRTSARQPRDVGLPAEDVRIPGPRGALAAWYIAPRNGCVLLCCHGINDNRGQWLDQIAALRARSGYGALLLDFSGHGESEGRLVTFGARETLDVAAALRYLRERGDVDMGRVGIMGYSLGAIAAVLAAAEMPEPRCVVIESGFADLERDLGMLFRRYTGLPSFPFAQLIVFWGQLLGKVRLSEIRPMRVIGRISPRAVFVISDLLDEIANEPYDGEHLYTSAGEPKRWWQVEGAHHVRAFELLPEEWVRRVGDFLDEHLAGLPMTPDAGAQRDAEAQRFGEAEPYHA